MNLTSLDRRWITWAGVVAVICAIVLFGLFYTLIVLTVTAGLGLLYLHDHNNREKQSWNYFTPRDKRFGTDLRSDTNNSCNSTQHTVFNTLQKFRKEFRNTLVPLTQPTVPVVHVNDSFKIPALKSHYHLRHRISDNTMASPFFKRGTVDRTSSKRRLSSVSVNSNHGVPLVAVGTPLSPHAFLRSPSTATPALPRVRRVNSESIGRYDLRSPRSPAKNYGSPGGGLFPHSSSSGHGDYPTHLPQYNGLGILPKVHLHPVEKPLLTEHNSRLASPVTVKIAPPDILKPPIPRILIPEEPQNEENTLPQISESKESGDNGREKRKRAMKDEEESPKGIIAPVQQNAKRRRYHEASGDASVNGHGTPKETSKRSAAEAVRNFLQRLTGRKRKPAPVEPDETVLTDDDETENGQETQHEPPQSKKVKSDAHQLTFGATGTPRNAIDVSYSSSKAFREDLNRSVGSRTRQSSWSTSVSISRGGSGAPSRESSIPPDSAASSQATEKSLPPSGTSTPRRTLGLDDEDDEDVPMLPATSSTPVLEKSDKEKVKVKSSRSLFPSKKTGTLKLRSNMIKGDTLTDFSKVPTMQYKVTSEDYAQDRQADLERVRKMLENPDNKEETDGKSDKSTPSGLSEMSSLDSKPNLSSSMSRASTLPMTAISTSSNPVSVAAVSPLVTSSSESGSNQAQVVPSSSANVAVSQAMASLVSSTTNSSSVSASSSSSINTTVAFIAPQLDTSAKDGQKVGGFGIPIPVVSPPTSSANSIAEQSKTDGTPTSSVVTTLFSFKPVFTPSSDASNASATSTTTVSSSEGASKFGASMSPESKDTNAPPPYSAAMAGINPSFKPNNPASTNRPSAPTTSLPGMFAYKPTPSASDPTLDRLASTAPSYNFGQKISASETSITSPHLTSSASSTNLAQFAASSGDQPPLGASFSFGGANSTPTGKQTSTPGGMPSNTATSASFAFGGAPATTKAPQQPSSTPFMFGASAPTAATSKAATTSTVSSSPFAFGAAVQASTAFGTTTTTAAATSSTSGFAFGGGATTAPTGSSRTPAFGSSAPMTNTSVAPAFKFGAGVTSPSAAPAFGSVATSITNPTTSTANSASPFTFGAAPNNSTATPNFAFKAGPGNTAGPFGAAPNAPTPSPFGGATNAGPTAATTGANTGFSFGNISSSNLKPAAPGGSITFGTAGAATTTAGSQAPFTFGAATNKPTASVGFSFGGQGPATSTAPASSSTFTFGGTNPGGAQQPNNQTNQSSFAFGSSSAQSSNATPFGNTAAAPTSASSPFTFGGASQTTTASSNMFGATHSAAANTTMSSGAQPKPIEFGKATPNQTAGFSFGGNQTSQAASPFGQQSTNAFGSTMASAGPFGSTSAPTSAFGSNVSSNTFGQPTTATPSKGFDFSASGGQNSSFNFGSPAVQFAPSPAGPAASPFAATPFNGASPAMPGADGMFSVGTGNTQPRQRLMRSAKRRTPKR